MKCGALDVVEAHDGDVCRHLQAVIHEGANGTDGGDVVVAEERGEIGAALDEFVGGLEAKFGCGDAELELDDEFRRHGQLEVAGDAP